MKKLALGLGVAALALSTTAMAANTGWFAGVQAGWNKYTNTSGVGSAKTSGFAYGIDGGYNFNQYFGVRSDLNKYNNLKGTGTNKGVSVKYYSLDVLAMGYYPLNSQYSLLGGVGMAYVHEKAGSTGESGTEHFYRPEVKVGAAYQIDQNWSAELTYSRIFGKGDASTANNAKDWLVDFNTVMLGVNYSF